MKMKEVPMPSAIKIPILKQVHNLRVSSKMSDTPPSMRDIVLVWDVGVEVPAKEIRPGIAAIEDPGVIDDRLTLRGTPYGGREEIPPLKGGAFYAEMDELLRILEGCNNGSSLLHLLAKLRPLPDDNGTLEGHYGDAKELGINPRKLTAYQVKPDGKPDRTAPVEINVVIGQEHGELASCHSQAKDYASNGYGTYATVAFHPRTALLIDRNIIPPELVLAHELIHAAHILSGCMEANPDDTAHGVGWKDPADLAKMWFDSRFNREYSTIRRWRHPDNKEAWDRLPQAEQSEINRLIDIEYANLIGIATIILQGRIFAKSGSSLIFQGPTRLEEAVTVGNDVIVAWLQGVRISVQPKVFHPAPGQQKADEIAWANYGRVQRYLPSNPTPEQGMTDEIAGGIPEWRIKMRNLTEQNLAADLHIIPRISYSPMLAKLVQGRPEGMIKEIYLTKPRNQLADSEFHGPNPIPNVEVALPPDGTEEHAPKPKENISVYLRKLGEWEAAARDSSSTALSGYPLRTACTDFTPIKAARIAEFEISEEVRCKAEEVLSQIEQNPGVNISKLGNRRMYRTEDILPIPPVVPSRSSSELF
ncbi:hypothetical protein ACIQU6_44275 [Streptomyces sp. NPDC090442]|uniref:hypothetical protein n=1 Tax=Streptomyces sp. NPDC090442 TaxID=3365962 RepID=UPI0037FAF524